MKKRGNIFICQRRLCIGRNEKGFAPEIPCLRFHLRSWQIYIILPSCLLGYSPFFFDWVQTRMGSFMALAHTYMLQNVTGPGSK